MNKLNIVDWKTSNDPRKRHAYAYYNSDWEFLKTDPDPKNRRIYAICAENWEFMKDDEADNNRIAYAVHNNNYKFLKTDKKLDNREIYEFIVLNKKVELWKRKLIISKLCQYTSIMPFSFPF